LFAKLCVRCDGQRRLALFCAGVITIVFRGSGKETAYINPLSRANFSASIAAPRAPAVSPLGIT